MTELGSAQPRMSVPLPGPASERWVEALARTECPAFTTRRARRSEAIGARHDPIVWSEARGSNVVDADGNVYVDLTSGFGVAAVGHGHPRVVAAVRAQAGTLLQALGDLHPSDTKVRLLERLAELAPFEGGRVALTLGGSDAIEAALKTATLASGKPGVVAFEGGYHGLGHGPLAACGYSEKFRAPFAAQLNPHVAFAPYPTPDADVAESLALVAATFTTETGALLIEPIQGRGGVNAPPPGFLAGLGELCRDRGVLLIADEIFTGVVRCGAMFRSVADGLTPDLICVGKALGGGMPVSALVGRPEVMAAWGDPSGEALHTGTFFGHPVASAAALATLDVIEDEGLRARATTLGGHFAGRLRQLAARSDKLGEVRGVGLMLGVVTGSVKRTLSLVQALLERGYLTLPAGASAEVLQLVPPVTTPEALLDGFVEVLEAALEVVP